MRDFAVALAEDLFDWRFGAVNINAAVQIRQRISEGGGEFRHLASEKLFRHENGKQTAARPANGHSQASRPSAPVFVVDHQLCNHEGLPGKDCVSYRRPRIASLRHRSCVGDDHKERNRLGNRKENELTESGFWNTYHVVE